MQWILKTCGPYHTSITQSSSLIECPGDHGASNFYLRPRFNAFGASDVYLRPRFNAFGASNAYLRPRFNAFGAKKDLICRIEKFFAALFNILKSAANLNSKNFCRTFQYYPPDTNFAAFFNILKSVAKKFSMGQINFFLAPKALNRGRR